MTLRTGEHPVWIQGQMVATMKPGYHIGLDSILAALERGENDLHYWRDSVRWLAKTSNVVGERNFCLQALNVMYRVFQLKEAIRDDVIKASCSLAPTAFNHIEVLERLVWILAEISTEADEPCLEGFCCALVDKIAIVGSLSKTRVDIIPSLVRLIGKFANTTDLLWILAEIILREDDAPGKIVWTLADHLPFRNRFGERESEEIRLYQRLGFVLLSSSSLKAKLHVCRAIGRIVKSDEWPWALRDELCERLRVCLAWVEGDSESNHDIDLALYRKYRQGLWEELSKSLVL